MKSTIDLESLEIFRAVVDVNSFMAAGEVLGKDKAHISRVVSRLEKCLGVQLLKRSTRRLKITEIGREFYERACGILTALEETEDSIARAHIEAKCCLFIGNDSCRFTFLVFTCLVGYMHMKVVSLREFLNTEWSTCYESFSGNPNLVRLYFSAHCNL